MSQPPVDSAGDFMYQHITCPHCGQVNDYDEQECRNCGVDLALAAGMAMYAFTSLPTPTSSPIAPEILVPRLGEILIEKGLLNEEDIQRASDYQGALAAEGKPCLFGQSLRALGLVTQETLDQVVTEQILQLQHALQQSNHLLEQRVEERTNDLQLALQKLSDLNQLKSNFIANISHELRTPLTHIKGYVLLFADGSLGPLNEEQQEAINVLVRAESRLEQLIEDLIEFSLMARGELSLNLRPVSVNDLITTTTNRAAKLARPRKVNLRTEITNNLPMINVDIEKISWVLLQLQDNAIKFTPQGGTVTVSASAHAGLVTLSVEDTGIGIAPERLSEIFEPFHQLDSSDTRHYAGTGLGLALVKRIIDAHASSIRVRSQINQGSIFEFSLPAREYA
jgi:signal transduction histidine kinase